MNERAWIEILNAEQGNEDLQRAYQAGIDPQTGEPANILAVQGANPQALLDHVALYRTLMFGSSPLSRRQREMIALVVSSVNGCMY